MKNILLFLLISLFLTSCTTFHNSSSVLHQKYLQYENTVNKNNIVEEARNFFSPSLLGNNYQYNPDAVSQFLFKNYMVNTDSSFEEISGQEGCLTINGYDEDRLPLIFSLKYILSNENWLIDNIHVVFVESENDFSNDAKCPTDYPN